MKWQQSGWLRIMDALAVCLVLAGCLWLAARPTPSATPPKPAVEQRLVKDMEGREISVPAQPCRMISFCTSATVAIVKIGAGDTLVAVDDYSRLVPGAEQKTSLGKTSSLSREQLLALQPDLAFVWWYQDPLAKELEALSVPVVRIHCRRAAEIPSLLRLVALASGHPGGADALAQSVEAFFASHARPATGQRPVVYLELYSPGKTGGPGTYVDDLIALAGGTNAAAGLPGYGILSPEELVRLDPDIILVAGPAACSGELERRPGLAQTKAMRHRQVHSLDAGWLTVGPGLPETVAQLEAWILNSTKGQ